MCGIVGYVGSQQAAPVLIEGLSRLEHRGYDSAGVAVLGQTSSVKVAKLAGRVRDLEESLPKRFSGRVGIGDTRWATHGPANDVDPPPPFGAQGLVAVVHNGIIDNAGSLRARLSDDGVDHPPRPTPRRPPLRSPRPTPTPPRARWVGPRRWTGAPTGSPSCTPTSPTGSSSHATAAR